MSLVRFTVPAVSVGGVCIGLCRNVNGVFLAVAASVVSAFTVKVLVPAVVGVPVILPSSLRLNPAGREPLLTLHVIEASPVAARIVSVYGSPTVPPGRLSVVMVGEIFTVPLPVGVPSRLPPLSTVMVLSSGTVRLDPSGIVRLSPSPMVKSSCKVTLPYTVPLVAVKDDAAVFFVACSVLIEVEELFTIPPLARTMVLPLTVRLGFPEPKLLLPKVYRMPAPLFVLASRGQAAAIHRQRGGRTTAGPHCYIIAGGTTIFSCDIGVLDSQGGIAAVALNQDSA